MGKPLYLLFQYYHSIMWNHSLARQCGFHKWQCLFYVKRWKDHPMKYQPIKALNCFMWKLYCGREKIKKYAKRYEKSIFQFFFIFLRKIGFFNLCYGEEKEERKTKKNKRWASIEFFIKDLFIINVNKYAFFFGLVHI